MNTNPQAEINTVLYAVAPRTELSTDTKALDCVSDESGICVGATSKPIQMFNQDCQIGIKRIPDKSIDCIITDPPYLYLNNYDFEKEFDEELVFTECKRVMKDDSLIVLFGRGISFYRWNVLLSQLGFSFKEEIIWNKNYGSSPLMNITRVHETISVFSKGNAKINKTKIPYTEMKGYSSAEIKRDINRIKTILTNKTAFQNLEKYLSEGELSFDGEYGKSTTITSGRKRVDRVVSTAQMILEGMNEKSIITTIREHYDAIHPTQKPVRLLERLLLLASKSGDTVLDLFSGSFSCAEACLKQNRNFIGFEIDKGFFEASQQRINNISNLNLFNK